MQRSPRRIRGHIREASESQEARAFRHWEIYDPNHPDDANYMMTDSNNPVSIMMMADRQVTAVFECGSDSGPLLPMALVLLGLCV